MRSPWRADQTAPRNEGGSRNWPEGIEPVALQDLKRLGRDGQNRLYWDGKLIRTTFKLTVPQQFIAVVATFASIATIFTGLNNASIFLCGRNVHWLGCPATVTIPPPPIATMRQEGETAVRLSPQ